MILSRLRLLTGATFLWSGSLAAQTEQKLNIDNATVFLSGAELVSSAGLSLSKGENEIIFTNVAGDVNSQSLSVSATNGVVMESATFQNNYLAAETASPQAREIKDSIELISESRSVISNKIAVLAELVTVLQGNRKVGGENTGLSVVELTKMLDLVNTKMDTYLDQKNRQEKLLKKADDRLANLKKQLDEEQKKAYQPGGVLRIKFYSKEPVYTSVVISYLVPHAGWTPTYDIWADDINSPIKLYYKANIFQNSGVKWNNVHLTLSTGNPNEGMQPPVLNPWYLAFYTAPAYSWNANNVPQAYAAKGLSMQDADRRGKEEAPKQQATISDYVSVDNSGVNTTFDIDLPYTIPSDGQQHLVAIKRYELPATYSYLAIPKLDKDAFLQAHITHWEDLNLLPGKTNIFYEGTYVGEGNIDVRNVKDTMDISLGRDKKIVVKRERDIKLRSVKTIGSNIRETFAYNISIRNARKQNIDLTVQDQQPVSNDKDIVIEDKETSASEYNETTGTMKWNLSVAANETKNLLFGYTVKYPKGKTVANLK